MKNLITRTITGLLFITLIITSFFISPVFFNILFSLFAILSVYEYLIIAKQQGSEPQIILPYLFTATLFLASQLIVYSLPISLGFLSFTFLLLLLIPFVELYRKKEKPLINIGVSIFPFLWIALPFALAGLWSHYFLSGRFVLALFLMIWLYDTLAYCAGSLFGKHPLFERVSPKKSWEGFIISAILTIGLSTIFYHIPYFANTIFTTPFHWMGFAAIIVIFSTLGDLVESLFKRSSNVKDSGSILPGHGGMLDRFDSFLFACPAGFIYWIICLLI